MNFFKISVCLSIFFFSNIIYAQRKQSFIKSFTTSNGIKGEVHLSTKPVTLSTPYLVIQADKIIVTSVNSANGWITRNELSDFGINFPFECTSGGFYASGYVSMEAYGTNYYDSGSFKTGGRITLGSSLGNTNQEIKFSQAELDRHREGVKAGLGSLWEKTGKVSSINVTNVSGADFGMILNAVNKYRKRKADELALNNKIKTIERSLHSYPKNTSELEYNLEKYQEIAAISDDSKYDEKMEQIRKRIEEIRKQEAAKTQNDKIADSDTQKSNPINTENSNETTENSNSSSSSKRLKLDKIEKEEITRNSDANYEARKFEMEQRFRDQKKLNNANYYNRNGDFLSAMVELNQVSGYNYREAQNAIKKIQYQALGQLSKQSIKRLEKYTRNVNFNGKDANEVLSEYSKKYNYVVSQFNESKSNVVDKTVSITAQRVGEKVGQGDNVGAVADGVMGIITATSAANQANEARERAIRELKFKRDNNLRGLRDKLVNEYSSASDYYYGKALNSMNERNEIIALNNYNYYQCRLKTINEKFSYENGNWAKNGSCSIPKENKINSKTPPMTIMKYPNENSI